MQNCKWYDLIERTGTPRNLWAAFKVWEECVQGQYVVKKLGGSSYCVDCHAGFYSIKPSADNCDTRCPTGYYSEPLARKCAACGGDKAWSPVGSAACWPCPGSVLKLSVQVDRIRTASTGVSMGSYGVSFR